jgi:ATP-dependent Clp protease ATP-binding subunit ClpA
MPVTISKELQATIGDAFADAKRRRHEFVTLEHVLAAMLRNPASLSILRACGADPIRLTRDLERFFGADIEPLPEGVEKDPEQTAAFWRVMQRAAFHVQTSGKGDIDSGDVLVAFFREADSHAVYLLEQQGVTRMDLLSYVSHGISKMSDDEEESISRALQPAGDEEEAESEVQDEDRAPTRDPLKIFTINLVEKAAAGQIDPLIGRAEELQRTVQVLCRRRKNNPVFVGEPGVGKTAMVEGLALAIHEDRVPQLLSGSAIYALDMGALLAGTKFRGEFEQRLKGVINAVKKNPKAILFIDEIHTIVGAGATSGGSMDASNLLKPALAAGELRCIGATTYAEYKSSFERDRALGRRFQMIEVTEPSIEETIQILRGLRSRYEEHHQVKYNDESLESAVKLSARWLNDRHLPDKAIDVLDEAGAANRLKPPDVRVEVIGPKEMEDAVARIARVPSTSVSASDEVAIANVEPGLKKVIFGQEHAIEQLSAAIKLSRSGLRAHDKPIGSFLFSGPTGVGKTELAKQLAQVLGVNFIRFDMTEYMEKHTVSRLIGAPPGYVGFDQGGLLTDAVRKTPHAVVVLDEIEKAHPDLYNILLQVMDHATLTDNNGRKADFRHVILILTTNAGAREMSSRKLGFGSPEMKAKAQHTREQAKSAIERTFSPEFRNRLDAWVVFEPLTPQVIVQVVDRQVRELGVQLAEKKIQIVLTDEARLWLAEHGFDEQFGARPMARLIENEIKRPLADAILFGALKNGGQVRVSADAGKLGLAFEPAGSAPVSGVVS